MTKESQNECIKKYFINNSTIIHANETQLLVGKTLRLFKKIYFSKLLPPFTLAGFDLATHSLDHPVRAKKILYVWPLKL
jgi:hypothetical protein